MTESQFEELSRFEDNFRRAVDSGWCRAMTSAEISTVKAIYESASSCPYRLSPGCAACVLKLMQKAGRLYFEEKGRRRLAGK